MTHSFPKPKTSAHNQFNFEEHPIHIWHVPLNDVILPPSFTNTLSETEMQRANRIRIREVRDQYVKTRLVTRKILGMYLNQPPEQVTFEYTSYHKPYLYLNPHAIEFNVSHSSTYALCVVSRNRLVGIDIEKVKHLDNFDQIVINIFSSEELSDYLNKPPEEKLAYFYRAWSRKEAFVKAQGKGMFHPVNQVNLAHLSTENPSAILLPDINGEEVRWEFNDFAVSNSGERYQACVFWQGKKESIEHFMFKEFI